MLEEIDHRLPFLPFDPNAFDITSCAAEPLRGCSPFAAFAGGTVAPRRSVFAAAADGTYHVALVSSFQPLLHCDCHPDHCACPEWASLLSKMSFFMTSRMSSSIGLSMRASRNRRSSAAGAMALRALGGIVARIFRCACVNTGSTRSACRR